MSTPPRRFEVVAPDLRLPMLVVGLTVMGCIGAAYFGWRAFPGGMRIGVLILLARALLIRDKPTAKPDKMASENVNA